MGTEGDALTGMCALHACMHGGQTACMHGGQTACTGNVQHKHLMWKPVGVKTGIKYIVIGKRDTNCPGLSGL